MAASGRQEFNEQNDALHSRIAELEGQIVGLRAVAGALLGLLSPADRSALVHELTQRQALFMRETEDESLETRKLAAAAADMIERLKSGLLPS